MKPTQSIRVKILPDGPTIRATGREAWLLRHLISNGSKGVTPIDQPAPRISAYAFDLRKMGLDIETLHEKHAGPFPGTHGRYRLLSQVAVLEDSERAAK